VPPKIREKNFGQFLCKIQDFSGKNHVKLGNFVNFSGKYKKNSGIVIIFRQELGKIRAFCQFFIRIFRAKMSCPLKLTASSYAYATKGILV